MAWARAQGKGFSDDTGNLFTSFSATLPNPLTSPSVLTVWIGYSLFTGFPSVTGVTDTAKNTYSRITSLHDNTSGEGFELWWAINNHTTASNIVTVAINSQTYPTLVVDEWIGGSFSVAVDKVAIQASAVTSPGPYTSPSITPSSNGELIIGFVAPDNANTATAVSANGVFSIGTVANSITNDYITASEYYVQPTAGAISASFNVTCATTPGTTVSNAVAIIALKSLPSQFSAAIGGKTSATISWTASADTVDGYNVYRSQTSGGELLGSPLNGGTLVTTLSFVDTTALPGQQYYVVTALKNGVESVFSTEQSAWISSSQVVANVTGVSTFSASITSHSTVSAKMGGPFSAAITSHSTVSAKLVGAIGSAITSHSTVSATFTGTGALAASITSHSTVSGVLKGRAGIAAAISSHSTVTATLTGNKPTPVVGTVTTTELHLIYTALQTTADINNPDDALGSSTVPVPRITRRVTQ